jgi:hypothetical protein
MTKIKLYPIDTNITDEDIVIGSDADNSDETKNFSVGDLKAHILAELPSKTYVALLSQSNVSAPTATVLRNSFDGAISFTYNGIGDFYMDIDDASFTDTYFSLQNTKLNTADTAFVTIAKISASRFQIKTFKNNAAGNDILVDSPIKIESYT